MGMGKALTPEQIQEGQAAIVLCQELRQQPDIVAYRHRRRVRGGKISGTARAQHNKIIRAKRTKAIRHKVILSMTKGITTNTEIAKALNVTPGVIKTVIEDRSFDKHLSVYQRGVLAAARYKLEDKVVRMAEKIIELAEHGTPQQKIQLEAARDILDRCGCKAREVVERIDRQYTAEETTSMLETAKEVEAIADRLSNSKSPYLITKATDTTSTKGISGPISKPV